MNTKLYGKQSVTEPIKAMITHGRMAHSFLLTGEKGVGKKTCALYIAKSIMCEDRKDGVPCGVCRQCRRIDEGTHPDVITPERTGKTLIYGKDSIRKMYDDAYTMPNDCDAKIYLLPDCESLQELTQNLLLKLIEEPPEYAYFIFTAQSKGTFLPTILSRVITLGIPECSDEECAAALREKGKYTEEQIQSAVEAFHGSIGQCESSLDGEGLEAAKLCREIVACMAASDEYGLCKALSGIGENRDNVKNILEMLDKVMRDVCAVRLYGENAVFIGCCRDGAKKLAERMSFKKALHIHDIIGQNIKYCNANINVPLAMSALCGEII
ncbi:MAG: ATP-binding protein [Oscillospiraceae bacterium]